MNFPTTFSSAVRYSVCVLCVCARVCVHCCETNFFMQGLVSGMEAAQEKEEEKTNQGEDEPMSDAEEDASDEDADDLEVPESPADVRENIKSKFLVEMPEDFYDFWKLCQKLNAEDPLGKILFLSINMYTVCSRNMFVCFLSGWGGGGGSILLMNFVHFYLFFLIGGRGIIAK